MNKIDWVTQKNIGFFYITQEWKDKVYNHILENTYTEDINQAYNNRNEAYIAFFNGDRITFIHAYSGATLGCRFTQIGYEKDIPDEIVDYVIAPAIIPVFVGIGINELEGKE